ncbi:hypothetical protein CRN37_09000 [Vibrio vulnificus]|uniref:hypothetical protein n=1 Tax=Vibrio vulnificus TaxID=672 RepID=UPI000CD07EF8|nr:hypothetical protein [Vibrio vulnificus]POC58823.1 hypothetical protein CRN37_09000 [Vibrio vulnificus]
MLNHLKSVVYGFSLFPRLFSFVFVGKLAFLRAVFRTLKLKHNKAFKWDSCRVAFLVCSEFWW